VGLIRGRARGIKTADDIPGWFPRLDRDLFRAALAWQVANQPPGDLVELGCYLGKSAAVIGESLQPTETFTVCDLFGDASDDLANAKENRKSYKTLGREQFEQNYLKVHPSLPVVLQMPSSEILQHVEPGSARFVHVDASHLYEHVVHDVASARRLLRPDGLAVFDDYRSTHAPGVAAAVWIAMANDGLKPVALTGKKWYGTWGDPTRMRRFIREWAEEQPKVSVGIQAIAGHRVLRIRTTDKRRRRRPAR
jgi:predicted O-methyltransferase YrrM